MLSAADMLIKARCGELAFLCCMSPAQLKELREILYGMTDNDVDRLHRVACSCAVPGSQGGVPGGGQPSTPREQAVPACVESFQTMLCGDTVMTAVVIADDALGLLLVGAGPVLPVPLRTTLMALYVMLEGWKQACLTKTIPGTVLQGICDGWDVIRTVIERDVAEGSTEHEVLRPVISLLENNSVVQWIDECCGIELAEPSNIMTDPNAWAVAHQEYLPAEAFGDQSPLTKGTVS